MDKTKEDNYKAIQRFILIHINNLMFKNGKITELQKDRIEQDIYRKY